MRSKSNQIFPQDIFQIFYKYDPLRFLLDLGQISFTYFVISFVVDLIIMSWYLKHNLEKKYLKEIGRWKIYRFIGKKIFTKLIFGTRENIWKLKRFWELNLS